MQEACDAFAMARYTPQYGVQGFYDTLIDQAQNMSVYPDAYSIMNTFLWGLPWEMHTEMLKNGLSPESNTVEDFVAAGKALEAATKTVDHYDHHHHTVHATTKPNPSNV